MAVEAIVCGTLLVLLDQWSKKALVLYSGASWGGILRIRFVINRRDSHSHRLFRTLSPWIWCTALVSAVVLYISEGWFHNHLAMVGLGLAFGGSAGNLLDMLRHGGISDFIDLRWWPVFNLADVGILSGLFLAFVWPWLRLP